MSKRLGFRDDGMPVFQTTGVTAQPAGWKGEAPVCPTALTAAGSREPGSGRSRNQPLSYLGPVGAGVEPGVRRDAWTAFGQRERLLLSLAA